MNKNNNTAVSSVEAVSAVKVSINETGHCTTHDLSRGESVPPMAYFSVSETPIKADSKAYTFGFEYTMYPWNELHNITSKYSYSTMLFEGGHRLKSKVNGYGNIFIFDIDSKPNKPSYDAREVIEAVKGLESLIVSTRSHTKDNHRLRLILIADKCMSKDVDTELYEEIMHTIIKFCGLDEDKLDASCFSNDRQYAPNPDNQIHYNLRGDVLPMEDLVKMAQLSMDMKKSKPKVTLIPSKEYKNGDLKQKREFIKQNLTMEFMTTVLEQQGLTVRRDGKVIIPGNKTDALSINPKTGVLADFGTGQFHDPVSVLHDYYKMPLRDATNLIYDMMGGV